MSASFTLTSSLRNRLAAVGRRARLWHAVRGFGLLVIVLGLSSGAALGADYWLDLPILVRQVLFCAWMGTGLGLLGSGVLFPLCRRIDARALAAVIERKYPELDERLTSSVELAESNGPGYGSPGFIAQLMDETERQSTRLDFRLALSARRAVVSAVLGAVVVFLTAAPALVWPRQYSDLTQRFFRPWSAGSTLAYTLEVTPGDTFAARGRTLTLSAHLVPRNNKVSLPQYGTLVVVDGDGQEKRQEMKRGEDSDFTIDYMVPGDVSYRIEAGEAVSASYCVTAVVPVELAAENPRITVTPPAYARATMEEHTFFGLVDLSALQYSEVRFDFRFTRSAEAAHLEWSAEGKAEQNAHALTLSDDRQTASFMLPAATAGKYRIVLEAEHGIRTVLEGGTIRVRPDRPPSVVKFASKESQNVHASERVPLEIEVADDIGVAGVDLEYRINDEPAVRQPMQLQGGNTPSARARHFLELSGKAQEKDRVHYRFHVRDNLPREYQGPHVLVYPMDRWLTLQVTRQGGADTEKEILTLRDEIQRKLESIKKALLQEQNAVAKVRQETANQSVLPAERTEQIKKLQEDNRNSQKALRDLARSAEAEPSLQPVSELARDVAEREMSASQKALDQAPKQPSPNARANQFEKADQQLASAMKRLDDLKKANDKLAQEQLDRDRLERLAERERQLAERTAELAAKNPVLDQAAKEQAEKIRRQQGEVAAELERMAQQSEALKQALAQAREEQARELAEHARQLAQAQRDLIRAEAETREQRKAEKYTELGRQQQELAEQAAKLAQETRQPAKTARINPLQPEEARRAAEALKQGDPKEAVKHQDQAAAELERLSEAFEKMDKQSASEKAAKKLASEKARILARKQRQLREAVLRVQATKRPEAPTAKDNPVSDLERQQSEVARQADELARNVAREHGEESAPSQRARQAKQAARQAARHLQSGSLKRGKEAGEKTVEQLRQLSAQLARRPRSVDPQKPDSFGKARQLGQRQEEINRRLRSLAGDPRAQSAQQRARQQSLQEQTGELMRNLTRLARQTKEPAQSESLRRASQASQQARQLMQQARGHEKQGNDEAARDAQEKAAQSLDRAARNASRTMAVAQSKPSAKTDAQAASPQSGRDLQQARQDMARARDQLAEGKPDPAQSAMRQAAQALAQAAQHMDPNSQKPGQPEQTDPAAGLGRSPRGLVDLSDFGLDKTPYAGKSWGELPGELRTKIVQDMKARYGEDYARAIKLYFEQLASTGSQEVPPPPPASAPQRK